MTNDYVYVADYDNGLVVLEIVPNEIEEIYGCMDSSASNFNPEANTDDGSCQYDVYGCMNMDATNYNPEATVDDGSCEFVVPIFGCVDSPALKITPAADPDDGTCI